MKKNLLCTLLLFWCSLVVYRNYWFLDRYFCGSDFFQQLVPLLNYQSDALRAGSFPLWNPYLNFGYPWIDNYLNSFLFPTHLLLGLAGFGLNAAQLELLTWIIIGGAGMYAVVRTLGFSATTATALGICFMFSGQLMPMPNWSNQVYNACCYPWLLYGYLRARERREVFSPISIMALALMLLGGYIASSVVGLYLFGLYVLIDTTQHRKMSFAARYIILTVLIALLIASPKIAPFVAGMSSSPRLAGQPRTDLADGVITLSSLISLLIPVKFYFALYEGTALIIALTYSVIRRRFTDYPLLITAIIGGWLLLSDEVGNPSLLRMAANILPFMKQVRLEFMYWHYPLTFLVLFAARPLHEFIEDDSYRDRLFTAGLAILVTTIFFFTSFAVRLHAMAYIVQICLLLGWLIIVKAPKRWRLLSVTGLLCLEFALIQRRVNIDIPYERNGDYLAVAIHHQRLVSRSYHDNELVKEQWPLVVFNDAVRPSMAESLRNPILQCDANNLADSMNLKLFNGLWYNTQEKQAFIRLRKSNNFKSLNGKKLYEYSKDTGDGVISLDRLTGSEFLFKTNSPEPGTLILRQMYDQRWRVTIDGTPTQLKTAESFFMGVDLPTGSHLIRFRFVDWLFYGSLALSVTTLLTIFSITAWRMRRNTSI